MGRKKQKNSRKNKELVNKIKDSGIVFKGNDMNFLNYGLSQFEDPFKERVTVNSGFRSDGIIQYL